MAREVVSPDSIDIRFGKLEGVLDHLKTRLGVVGNDHFHDVEPEQNVGIIEHAQPGEATARDARSLIGPNCFEWSSEVFASSRFYFHENKCVIVAADNVDLATPASAKIAVENFVTLLAQKTAGQRLAASAALEMLR